MADPQTHPTNTSFHPFATRPRTMQIAVIGMWIGALMAIIYVYIWFLEAKALNAQSAAFLEEKYGDQAISADSLMDAGMTVSLGINAVIAIVTVSLWGWMAIANGRGISWARIVATSLGIAGLLYTGFSAAAASAEAILIPTSVLFYSMHLILIVATLALLWAPSSTRFYRAASTRRRTPRSN